MAIILVAEDEESLRKILVRFLSGLGHHVLTAANGADALTLLEEGGVDLLVTDINLPEVDGIEILKALSARGTTVPVIAMSGGGTFDKGLLLGSSSLLGAVDTLEKPFELDALRASVDRALAAPSSRASPDRSPSAS
jgi:two-component system response regulator AtoC